MEECLKITTYWSREAEKFVGEWKETTFTDDVVPIQNYPSQGIRFDSQETEVIYIEINKHLEKGVIIPSQYEKVKWAGRGMPTYTKAKRAKCLPTQLPF